MIMYMQGCLFVGHSLLLRTFLPSLLLDLKDCKKVVEVQTVSAEDKQVASSKLLQQEGGKQVITEQLYSLTQSVPQV